MKNLQKCLDLYVEQENIQNIAVRAGIKNDILCDVYRYTDKQIDSSTLFDMASVTKIMVTTSLALVAIDRKLLSPKDLVANFFEVPDNKRQMTVENLLTHTMGIGHKPLNKEGNNYNNIEKYILALSSDVAIGCDVLYSCPGYILLGKIIEKIFNEKLDKLFSEYIAGPLGMKKTSFLPSKNEKYVNSNLNASEAGVVNDYNCRFLGGVAGNAGLFSNVEDVCKYIAMLKNFGAPLISKETFNEAIKNHTPDMQESRGWGFVYVDKKYSQTGKLFSEGSIGHCGHTGQSVFVDLNRGLYCVILSDATISGVKKYGDEKYDIVMKMRRDIHNAIYDDLNIEIL